MIVSDPAGIRQRRRISRIAPISAIGEQQDAGDGGVGAEEVERERVVAVVRERLREPLGVDGVGARRERVGAAGDVVLEALRGDHAAAVERQRSGGRRTASPRPRRSPRRRPAGSSRSDGRAAAALPGRGGGDRGQHRAGVEQALMRRAEGRVDLVLEAVRLVPDEVERAGDRGQRQRREREPRSRAGRRTSRAPRGPSGSAAGRSRSTRRVPIRPRYMAMCGGEKKLSTPVRLLCRSPSQNSATSV